MSEFVDEWVDITNNLSSLQFESALTDEEEQIINLRQRSHAHTVTVCAQATYYVVIVNEARQINKQLKNPTVRRATRIIHDAGTRDVTRIGIVGCGRLGSHLVHSLLSFGEVNPHDLYISTRRPETLAELQRKGATCLSNNADVAAKAHILFLCVLPSQFPAVAEDIRGHVAEDCVVYSLMATMAVPRIKQLLTTDNIICPEFEFADLHDKKSWDNTLEVTTAFSRHDMLEKTCPLSFHKKDSVVCTKEKLAEQMIYALVNMCTRLRLSRSDVMDILNLVVLGHTDSEPNEDFLLMDDITKHKHNKQYFPHFDLSATLNRDTPITKKLVHCTSTREAFVHRYCTVFRQYLEWTNTALGQVRKELSLANS